MFVIDKKMMGSVPELRLPAGRVNREKKIPDFPAVITSRRSLDKYRLDTEKTDLRRVHLDKPQKPNSTDWLGQRAKTEIKMPKKTTDSMSTTYGVSYSHENPSSHYSKLPSLKSTHKVKKPGPIVSPPDSNLSVISQASSKTSHSGFDTHTNNTKLTKLMTLSINGTISDQVPSPEDKGLFSTYGVSGSKARFSSADKIYRSVSYIDLSSLATSSEAGFMDGLRLRRSSSLMDLDKLRGNLRRLSMSNNSGNDKDQVSPKQSVKPKKSKKVPGKKSMNKHIANANQKLTSKELKKKASVKDKVTKLSTKTSKRVGSQDRGTNSEETQPNTNYSHREISTQSTEGCESEFEVVRYL